MTERDETAAPAGYQTVTPYLIAEDASSLIEFVREVFGAELLHSSSRPDGRVGHTELRIGESMVMVSGSTAEWAPAPAALLVYVGDADEVHRRGVERGARSIMEPADTSYGDRMGGVVDRWGNQWWVATRVGVPL